MELDGETLRVLGWDGSSLVAGPLGGADPLGFAAGDANLYRYVGNDPTGMIDPSGLEADSPAQSTVTDVSTTIIGGMKKKKDNPPQTFPGDKTVQGSCATFAKKLADALKDKNIPYKLHFYNVSTGPGDGTFPEFIYTTVKGKEVTVPLALASVHIIVEVKVMCDGKETTIFLDAGADVGGPSRGNVGDPTTGVIAPPNQTPKDTKTGKPILTEF